ncbi:MAG: Rid family detoxifying hydrolase [Colwellia polaris]|jgi:2-iminobutanoate/2-iminopropanoate deaminase
MNKISLLLCTIAPLLFHNMACAKQLQNVASEPKNVEFLNTKPASKTLPFSEAVRVENTLYLSGQIGIDPKTSKLAKGGVIAETNQTLTNIQQVLKSHGYDMQNVVKCTVMLTNIADFAAFNRVYTRFFSPPYPARSAFAVNKLALNATVEVECIASTH